MAIEIVDFPIKNGGSFHGKMLVYQRVGAGSIPNEKQGNACAKGNDLKLRRVNEPMSKAHWKKNHRRGKGIRITPQVRENNKENCR